MVKIDTVYQRVLALANKGVKEALLSNPYFLQGLNTCLGHVTHHEVANDLGFDYLAPHEALGFL